MTGCSEKCVSGWGEGMAATLCVDCDGPLCVLCRRTPVEELGDQCDSCAYDPDPEDFAPGPAVHPGQENGPGERAEWAAAEDLTVRGSAWRWARVGL